MAAQVVVVVMPKGMVKVQSPLTVRWRPCSSVTRRKPCPAAATSCPSSDNRCPCATRVQVVSGNVAIIGKAGAPVSYSERVGSNMVSDGARRAGNTPDPRYRSLEPNLEPDLAPSVSPVVTAPGPRCAGLAYTVPRRSRQQSGEPPAHARTANRTRIVALGLPPTAASEL